MVQLLLGQDDIKPHFLGNYQKKTHAQGTYYNDSSGTAAVQEQQQYNSIRASRSGLCNSLGDFCVCVSAVVTPRDAINRDYICHV